MLLIVVLDACVLFPASLRDTLLRAADMDLFRMKITDEILEEARRNLVKNGMRIDKAQRLMASISEHYDDAFVTHYKALIASMPNDKKDRHVLAAAVACKAQVIVTQNLKDFPKNLLAPFEIEAQSPDQFLISLFRLAPEKLIELLTEQAAYLHNPPMTVYEVLDTLSLHAPLFASLVRRKLDERWRNR